MIKLTHVAALATACVLSAGAINAQTSGNPADSPRRDQIRDRTQDTNDYIAKQRSEGNITRGEAHEMRQDNREIAHDANQQMYDGRSLTRGEQSTINKEQTDLNRQITREAR